MKQTPEFIQACKRLRANPDFQVIFQGILAYGDKTMEQLIYHDANVFTLQGKARAVSEITKMIVTAQNTEETR